MSHRVAPRSPMPATLLLLLRGALGLGPPAGPVRLILDTDMGGGACQDVDDVAALCMTHALADRGEVELLAVVQDTAPPPCAGVISVINHYYGRDHVPIGAYKGQGLHHSYPPLSYVNDVVRAFPSPIRNNSQVRDAVKLYRRVLADAATRSVTISSVGLLTNLELLLRSAPDEHSQLRGVELVAEKVALLVVMAGRYPSSQRAECNACGCYNGADRASAATASAASSYVVKHMPRTVRMVFLGGEVGENVRTGEALESCATRDNPCRHAYMAYRRDSFWGWAPGGRSSWDPLATLVAIRGASAEREGLVECSDCSGINDVFNGRNTWRRGRASNQSYLVLERPDVAKAALADAGSAFHELWGRTGWERQAAPAPLCWSPSTSAYFDGVRAAGADSCDANWFTAGSGDLASPAGRPSFSAPAPAVLGYDASIFDFCTQQDALRPELVFATRPGDLQVLRAYQRREGRGCIGGPCESHYSPEHIFFAEVCALSALCANGGELFSLPAGQRFECHFSAGGFEALVDQLTGRTKAPSARAAFSRVAASGLALRAAPRVASASPRPPARRFELHSVGEPTTGDEGGAALSTPAELRAAIDRLAALCSSPPRVAAELLDKVEARGSGSR
ncbi:hypothetical protein EMIHUDRAFT_245775 [Emiliania huxleyi CCMP1516]|uniref:Inosine/uridine-preferring nucleoside hydrolase domain-containing protein n=3 Tax=Emiliania huxleyi TaxID=2903 RepID=A0A0D3IW79_EMIH1|nr:hypothetical protein EMIHUDRAFT_245775 [Emiliania huxleyi CCMP1516]EOD15514.1 hypothetical protein EMIHUDRAFT_245775 [Emiliania huxleyi CCMP1516]|eukprot:XP_005767943.1 hypothetical protein EMIHUDRAFT_245775 [Emiliania huxleyi CCMP1516]